ncbi:hypothetical protein [uncultured Nostoc sp.]|uniref:hypothetical protein n=1 Tax=uncultured Nostoc sp. TaxID=340711 RepID=UPI0035CA0EB9
MFTLARFIANASLLLDELSQENNYSNLVVQVISQHLQDLSNWHSAIATSL